MTREELENLLRNAVEDYTADEEAYDDNARLRIDPQSKEVSITDGGDEVEDADYYDVMDLIKMSPSDPRKWEVDEDAVKSVAEEYIG